MRCDNPLFLVVKDYMFFKNGQFCSDYTKRQGKILRYEIPGYTMPIRCGKCSGCLSLRVFKWQSRISYASINKYCYFLTLTFDNNNLPEIEQNKDSSYYIKCFFKRFRKNEKLKVGDLKYFWSAERGAQSGRLHYHCFLILNNPILDFVFDNVGGIINKSFYYNHQKISKSWKFGFHSLAKIKDEDKDKVVKYVIKYIFKSPLSYGYSKGLGLDEIKENEVNGIYYYNGQVLGLPSSLKEVIPLEKRSDEDLEKWTEIECFTSVKCVEKRRLKERFVFLGNNSPKLIQ